MDGWMDGGRRKGASAERAQNRERTVTYVVSHWNEKRKMRNGHIHSSLLLVTFCAFFFQSGRNGMDAGRKRRK